jgi:ubiquinone/menaquinone biosynthesis C-methylase UbiE
MTKNQHWNDIFTSKETSELGWYEEDVSQTIKFLDLLEEKDELQVFLSGAGTSLLVDALLEKNHKLILNDISDEALKKLKERIGKVDHEPLWLCHDISKALPNDTPKVDLWIDRAVLHFLLETSQIEQYFKNLSSTVKVGGHALLAEFSTRGAMQCAGLKVHRYSLEEMVEKMGKNFELVKSENHTYMNPFGDSRHYVYALFEKIAEE